MENAKVLFVTFEANDVMTASGGSSLAWFIPTGFPCYENNAFYNCFYLENDSGFKRAYVNLLDENGDPIFSPNFDAKYQLISGYICTEDVLNDDAYVYVNVVDKVEGTQITTYGGILEWISNYGEK